MATVPTDGYALLKTIALPGTLGGHGDWVTYDADTKTVWLVQSPDNNVVVIDTVTNTIKAVIPNIGNGNGIALSSQYAFVADVTNNTTDVIDKRTFQLVTTIPQTGTTPDSVTYISSTNQVAVASDDNNVEDLINASAPFTQTASVQLQPNPAVTGPDVSTYVPSKDLLYQPGDQQINVINPHTGAIVAIWPLLTTGSVKPIVYDPVTNHFLVGTTNKQMLVVDGNSGQVLKTVSINGSVDEAAIDVGARLAFVGDKAGTVDVINLDSSQLVGTLPAEVNMHTLTVDPTTHDVYVYENYRNTVDVYATAPQAPSYVTPAAISVAQSITTTADAQILAGTLLQRSPNADGSAPAVTATTGGVLVDSTGGHALTLPSNGQAGDAGYAGAYLLGSAADTVFGGSNSQAAAGQVFVSGSAGLELILAAGTKNAVVAAGNNIIFDNADTDQIVLDNGNNTMVENGAVNTNITAGTGNNLIGVNGSGGTVIVNSTGNDTVIAAGGSVTVDAGLSGSSVSEMIAEKGGRLTFVGGAGAATINGGTGTEYVRGGSGTLVASGNAGGGDLLVGGTGNTTLFGGGNGDTLVAGLGSNMLVAGAGNETLTGAFPGYTVNGNNTYFTGSGNDVISTGNGNESVYAGSGNATITLGTGNDLVAIWNGVRSGGTAVINGFNVGRDHVGLSFYAGNEAANALGGAQIVGGSEVLTLSDGTKLTFSGVTNLSSSNFV